MTYVTQSDILRVLGTILDQGRDIVSSGIISNVNVKDGKVSFLINIHPHDREKKAWLEGACEKAVKSLPGVTAVTAVLTAETGAGNPPQPIKRAVWNTTPVEGVLRVIAVSSGKGGVGKSTTAVNLAHALVGLGRKVGLLDADIYGPSLPRMMGLSKKPEVIDGRIIPLIAHGIACMSIGLLVGEDSAIIWRGPQAAKALQQMLRDVVWADAKSPLDVLLVDMPPGTGDVHLSLVQQAPISGAIIVTTPQDVAVADARKSIDMFHKVNVPVLGIIENMSGFVDPASGKIHAIFGEGGGLRLAESTRSPFLGSIPIDIGLREASDGGMRYGDKAQIYRAIAEKIAQ